MALILEEASRISNAEGTPFKVGITTSMLRVRRQRLRKAARGGGGGHPSLLTLGLSGEPMVRATQGQAGFSTLETRPLVKDEAPGEERGVGSR